MKGTYWQRGESLDFKNNFGSKIEANTVIALENHIGIAAMDIMPGEIGSVHVTGVYEFNKVDGLAVAMGTQVYFSNEGITLSSENNVPVGFAAADSPAESLKILVKINA